MDLCQRLNEVGNIRYIGNYKNKADHLPITSNKNTVRTQTYKKALIQHIRSTQLKPRLCSSEWPFEEYPFEEVTDNDLIHDNPCGRLQK